jgi:hypothetical protein
MVDANPYALFGASAQIFLVFYDAAAYSVGYGQNHC